jgi:hypothetical protein
VSIRNRCFVGFSVVVVQACSAADVCCPGFPYGCRCTAVYSFVPGLRKVGGTGRLLKHLVWRGAICCRGGLDLERRSLERSRSLSALRVTNGDRVPRCSVSPGSHQQCPIPQTEEVKYLHLDRRVTWHLHRNETTRYCLNQNVWLLGHKSKLSIDNKLLIYKPILKPIWAYGVKLW